jgi:NADH dehydrogenase (ubiquinone) flavoprotein 3
MASNSIILRHLCKFRNFSSFKRSFTAGKIIYNKQTITGTSVNVNVQGLSKAVVDVPSEPVGPGAAKNTDYKNPEYFCYDKNSFFEAEVEMLKYRCPQPSTKVYYKPSTQ